MKQDAIVIGLLFVEFESRAKNGAHETGTWLGGITPYHQLIGLTLTAGSPALF